MRTNLSRAWPLVVFDLFMGRAPRWYKAIVVTCLVLNPLLLAAIGPFGAGWLLLAEFIFTLAMALRCYPLQPGGLLALEAICMGLASPDAVYRELTSNFGVILLLMFMVAGIYFLRDLLLLLFTRILVAVRSKAVLSLIFCGLAALLSAFLDALTVIAVTITVATGFYAVYHRVASGGSISDDHDHANDEQVLETRKDDLEQFRAFLRSLLMHAAIGTALGGVCTQVGEPQNLLIGQVAGWRFGEFFTRVAPVSLPVVAVGLWTCVALEKLKWFGYGIALPDSVRDVIERHDALERDQRSRHDVVRLWMQALAALFLVTGLALHLAEVGLIGLTVIILATVLCGVIEEKHLGHAFEEALPFTALIVTFFAVVAVIHEQHLFKPVIEYVLARHGRDQLVYMYVANGLLSAISDNVFVATVYIGEVKAALQAGTITREQFNLLAVAVNTGTNIPSVATPNGQAAFLFLLTSALAPLIRLGYSRMLWMALPYTITMSLTGLVAVLIWL